MKHNRLKSNVVRSNSIKKRNPAPLCSIIPNCRMHSRKSPTFPRFPGKLGSSPIETRDRGARTPRKSRDFRGRPRGYRPPEIRGQMTCTRDVATVEADGRGSSVPPVESQATTRRDTKRAVSHRETEFNRKLSGSRARSPGNSLGRVALFRTANRYASFRVRPSLPPIAASIFLSAVLSPVK